MGFSFDIGLRTLGLGLSFSLRSPRLCGKNDIIDIKYTLYYIHKKEFKV
jgi:hypothetical protein